MCSQVYRIESYTFSSTDAVLFDANIWLYIYGPQGDISPRFKATYSLALRRIRSAKIPIFIDVLVLSEFINASARFFYNRLPAPTKPAEFKAFRNSADFKPIAERIAKLSRRILQKSQRIESNFESVDLVTILRDYQAGEVDFNDRILAEMCRARNLKLVTHDADFQEEDVAILTANPRLLS